MAVLTGNNLTRIGFIIGAELKTEQVFTKGDLA